MITAATMAQMPSALMITPKRLMSSLSDDMRGSPFEKHESLRRDDVSARRLRGPSTGNATHQLPDVGTWCLQQGIDIARQSAVPPNRCVNSVPSRISCGASCPHLISGYPKILLTLLTLAMMTGAASAQLQRTFFDAGGNVVGRSSTDSQGSTTNYDARGNVTGRSSTSGNTTTVYDPAGRNVGRFTTNR
jgi:YD repeat-containing protein